MKVKQLKTDHIMIYLTSIIYY